MARGTVTAAGVLLIAPVVAAVSVVNTLILHGTGGRPDLLLLVGVVAIFALGQPQVLLESAAAMFGLAAFLSDCICDPTVICAVERGTAEADIAGLWIVLVPCLVLTSLVWTRRFDAKCVLVAGLISVPLHIALADAASARLAEHRAKSCTQDKDEGAPA